MRIVVAHGRARERGRFQRVLAEAGHEVTECDCPGDALECCRRWRPDVAVVDAEAGAGLLDRIKRDADAFGTAVLLVEAGNLPFERATEALATRRLDVRPLIERVAPLEAGPDLFRQLARAELDAVKVILTPALGDAA